MSMADRAVPAIAVPAAPLIPSPVISAASVSLDRLDLQALRDFYRHILLPSFGADELETEESMAEGLAEGRTIGIVARTADGTIAGGVVAGWFAASRVLLGSYLAVRPEYRGLRIGTRLLAGRTLLADDLSPRLIVGEIEDPRHYRDTTSGDPARRLRLYEDNGARTLQLPYFQPAPGPGRRPVPHLLLMVFGGTDSPPGTRRVDGALVESFLSEYFDLREGPASGGGAGYQAMITACRWPGGLPLLLLRELPAEAGA